MDPLFHPVRSVALPTAITALAFDTQQDLLHVGQIGQVSTLNSIGCIRYSSVSTPRSSPALDLLSDDRSLYTLSPFHVGASARTGQPKWSVPLTAAKPAFCLSGSTEMTLTTGEKVMAINTGTGTITRTAEVPFMVSYVKAGYQNSVVMASMDGKLSLFDSRSQSSASSSNLVHMGGLSYLETSSHLALTLGYSLKAGRPHLDNVVKLFDLRHMLRPCTPVPIPFSLNPSMALFHPRDQSKILLVSPEGSVSLSDTNVSTNTEFQMLSMSEHITSAKYSSSGDVFVLGESNGLLHLYSSDADQRDLSFMPRNMSNRQLEYPDNCPPPPAYDWTPLTPLNLIGMPYYTTPLLSNFPQSNYASKAYSPLFRPAKRIPQEMLDSARVVDGIGYVKMTSALTSRGRRNQVSELNASAGGLRQHGGQRETDGTIGRKSPKSATEPKFRSEQKLSKRFQEEEDVLHGDITKIPSKPLSKGQIPRHYRKVEIKYSRFGIEDFDFGFYNTTSCSGLETDIANSYANSLLQAVHHVRPLREICIAHTREPCNRENCLLCELGFLSRMLQDARGINCQASNFSRALSLLPQSHALGLIDGSNEDGSTKHSSLVQTLHRFLIGQLSTEAAFFPLAVPLIAGKSVTESVVTQLCGISTITTNVCSCKDTSSRVDSIHVIDLVYPRKGLSNEPSLACTFPSLLGNSVVRDTFTKHTCAKCQTYAPLHSRRSLVVDGGEPPAVLCINAAAHSPEQLAKWAVEDFLPAEISVTKLVNGGLDIVANPVDQAEGHVYVLRSVVQQIQDSKESCHLVCVSRLDDPGTRSHKWMMFNDFLVRELPEREALNFAEPWKTPAVLFYERRDSHDLVNYDALPQNIDISILTEDSNIAWNRNPSLKKHSVLTENDLPKRGSKVAIDAEFVEMQQEELEFKADGSKSVLRPSRLGLARVSVLRGDTESDISPFVDDYIHTSEPVVDYLTEFSGIIHGDLDPSTSCHTLVTRKMAYKKIRLLLDLGCIFVGHGLYNDFRIINIFVPAHQILDTVDIYAKKNQSRKLSLKFLSWYVLKEDIQTETHDSIEDARGALLLYRHYMKLQEDNLWDEFLEELFRNGRLYNFRPSNAQRTGQADEPFTPPQGHRTPSILSPSALSQLNTPASLPRTSSWASIAMG